MRKSANERPLYSQNFFSWADPEEERGSRPPEKSQKYRVSLQYWFGSPKNDKATKPAFNVGPPSARQRNAIEMRRFAGGPIMAHLTLKKVVI